MEGRKRLKDHTDSLWFMEGEEEPDGDQEKWDTLDRNFTTCPKRRKMSAEIFGGNPPQSGDQRHPACVEKATFLGPATMQNRATFSFPGSGGFISAAAQLHCITEAGYDVRQKKSSKETPRLPSSRRSALHREENANVGPKPKDKSNMLSLWFTKPTQSQLSNSNATNSCQEQEGDFRAGARSHKDQLLPQGELQKYSASMQDQTQVTYTKRPLNVIPPSLANHELYSRSHQTRHRADDNNQQSPKHYFFLSSSPTRTDDLAPLQANADNNDGGTFCTEPSLKKRRSESESCGGNTRPASTFHTTSVAAVKAGANHSKKTLGIRRSMTGWTCRRDQRFCIPGKAQKEI